MSTWYTVTGSSRGTCILCQSKQQTHTVEKEEDGEIVLDVQVCGGCLIELVEDAIVGIKR